MQYLYYIVSYVALFCISESEVTSHWIYGSRNGSADAEWVETCNIGHNQSPIDIITENAIPDTFRSVTFHNYSINVSSSVASDMHSLLIHNLKPVPSIKLMNNEYLLHQVHFHWGGSEHTLDGVRYKSEAHFVHYHSSYKTYADALQNRAIVVVAILLEESDTPNAGLNTLNSTTLQSGVVHRDVNVILDDFFADKSEFFEYSGSLTTPPCSEGILWLVAKMPSTISAAQINWIYSFATATGLQHLTFRPTKPIYSRSVLIVPSSSIRHSGISFLSNVMATILSTIIFKIIIAVKN